MEKEQAKIITIETGNLLDLMRPGILALIDYSNGRAYLSDAVNIAENYFRQLKLIHQGQHVIPKEDLHLYKGVVVEFVEDPRLLRYAFASSCHKMTVSNINIISRNIKYRIKGHIQPDFRSTGKGYLYHVYLYSQQKPVKLLGVFNNGIEAEEFMQHYYPNKQISGSNVVVCDNELTELYVGSYKDTIYKRLMDL